MNRTANKLASAAFALVVALPITLTTGCSLEEGAVGQVGQALEETQQGIRHRRMHRRLLRLATEVDVRQAPEAVMADLEALVAEKAPCATTESDGTTLTVNFGALEDACAIDGHVVAGSVALTLEEVPSGTKIHEFLSLFGNDEFAVEGTLDVVATSGGRAIESALAMSRGDMAKTIVSARVENDIVGDDGSVEGVEVEGMERMSCDRGTRTRTMEGVVTREGDNIPEAGRTTMESERGVRTMRFERVDDTTISVTLESDRGTTTVEVPDDGDLRELLGDRGRGKRGDKPAG